MSSWLIGIVGVIYFVIGIDSFIKGNIPMSITFLGYALSNIGLYELAS